VTVDNGMVARLRRQLATGDVVLFTGAGFSMGATARDGQRVASVNALKEDLWRLGFPSGHTVDSTSSLGDVFDVAVSRHQNRVKELFERRLTVSAAGLPARSVGTKHARRGASVVG